MPPSIMKEGAATQEQEQVEPDSFFKRERLFFHSRKSLSSLEKDFLFALVESRYRHLWKQDRHDDYAHS